MHLIYFLQIIWLSAPHIIINLLLCIYLVGGAAIFRLLDEDMARADFRDIVLFNFITLTTIGQSFCHNAHSFLTLYLNYFVFFLERYKSYVLKTKMFLLRDYC